MDTIKFEKEELCSVYTFVGSFSDLTLIDFSFLNLQFINIDDESEIKSYFEKASVDGFAERNIKVLGEIKKDFIFGELMYLLVPIQLKKIPEAVINNCIKVLTVIFPSNIQIHNEVHFQLFDEKYLSYCGHSVQNFHFSGLDEGSDYFMLFHEESVKDINNFILLYFERLNSLNYLKPIVFNYISSFRESYLHLAFVSLCICLESIVIGTNDISYRIRRNLAVLCGDNPFRSEKIFNNVKKIYDLRSRIVHGSDYNYEQLGVYLIYVRALISRMIIELVLHNIISLEELDKKLTIAGFGAYRELSQNYIPHNLNITTYVEIISNELPKIKSK